MATTIRPTNDAGADLVRQIDRAMDQSNGLTARLQSGTLTAEQREQARAARERVNAREIELRAAYDRAVEASYGPETVTESPDGRAVYVGQTAGIGGGGRSTYLRAGSPEADAAIARRDAERAADAHAIRLACELVGIPVEQIARKRVTWFTGGLARVELRDATGPGCAVVIVEGGVARLAQ
jgi:hypothetical protein